MFKRVLFLLTALAVLVSPSIAFAQTEPAVDTPVQSDMILPYPQPDTGAFLGQHHAYTVTFRGNGEAVVAARIALTNDSDQPLKEVELRLPEQVNTSELTSFQVIREPICIMYQEQSPLLSIAPSCLEYAPADYYQPWGQNKYQKATVTQSGDTLKITLPIEILANESGAYFVYYRSMGLTSKDVFGVYDFDFETMKVNENIQNLSIGISTDSDLVIKGGQGQVDYRFEDQSRNLSTIAGSAEKLAAPSAAIDSFYGQIGYGAITKTASNLAALESYKVSGAFAANNFQLYAKEVVIGLGVLVLVILLTFVLGRLIFRKTQSGVENASNAAKAFVHVFVTSIGSAVLVGLYTGLLLLVGQLFNNIPYYWEYQQFIWLLVAVISFAVYAFLIVAPSIFIGLKKGIGWGFGSLGLTILWLIILVVIFVGVIFFSSTGANPIVPYLNKGMEVQRFDSGTGSSGMMVEPAVPAEVKVAE